MTNPNPMLNAALEFYDAGCSVIPARVDGTKAPVGNWKQYQKERPTREQVVEWFKNGHQGIGVVTGLVSGRLEMLEMEGRAVEAGLLDDVRQLAMDAGLAEVWEVISQGYVEVTPSGGLHWLYRIADEDVPQNTKLASRPGENGGVDVLAETRGEGGFTIVSPSHGSTHPSGKAWQMIQGAPHLIPVLSWEEREALHSVFQRLDKMPQKEVIANSLLPKTQVDNSLPGDDFNNRATWDEILIPEGWRKVSQKGTEISWCRPGKTMGISATTGMNEADRLYVFSTSTIFEANQPYNKFSAYALIHHAGDYREAARDLRSKGFGAISLVQDTGIQPFTPALTPEEVAQGKTQEEKDFEFELRRTRIRRDVKRALDSEEALKTYDRFSFVPNLEDELKLPEEEIAWTIPDLIPTGANVTLTAQYKAGKTTLINNLAMALADGQRFLNYFKPANHLGRIVIFNYEVSENQYRRWMKDISIENSGKVTLVHLRGKAVPMISDYVRKEVIETLQSLNCQTWIVDPFARAFTGSGDENSNSDVGVFLDQLDIIKERAGVSNLILPVHTGRAQEQGIERARGATRLDDWADVRWLLKKTEDGRFFSADGRDVMLEEQMLRWDERTRHLTLGGADAKTAKRANLEDLWVETVKTNPGLTTGALCQILGKGTDDKGLAAARKSAIYYKRVKSIGVGSATLWHPADYIPPFQMSVETA